MREGGRVSAPGGLVVRPATVADAELIAWHRVGLFRDTLPPERVAEADALFALSRDTLREVIEAGTSLAWIAEAHEPAGSLVMHLVNRLPSPTSPNGREGYVVHVYVDTAWRNAGVGAALLAEAEAAGRALALSRIRLHAIERAVPLYARAGYRMRSNDMERILPVPPPAGPR